jgi:acetyl esterase/lipase
MSLQIKVVNFVLRNTIKPLLTYVPFQKNTIWLARDVVGAMTHVALRPKAEYETVSFGKFTGEWVRYHKHKTKNVVLYLHGGGYLAGSPSTHRTITSAISKHANCSVLAIDYRKAPEYTYPSALEDALYAYNYLLNNGYEAKNISIAGDSAGGNLTLVLTQRLVDLHFELPSSICCISPWCDIGYIHSGIDDDPMLPSERIREAGSLYAGQYGVDSGLHSPYLSPLYSKFDKSWPPTLFSCGEKEVLQEQMRLTFGKIIGQTKSKKHKYEEYKGCPHVFQMFYGFVPESTEAIKSISKFFLEHWNQVA